MRYLFTISIVFLLTYSAQAQNSANPYDYKWTMKPDSTVQYIGALDSLNSFIQSNRNSPLLSNRGIKFSDGIESNGYRGADGILYTMRIIIPGDNHAAIRQVDWDINLEDIDPNIVFPPVKKKE